jgi:hypothetical protein
LKPAIDAKLDFKARNACGDWGGLCRARAGRDASLGHSTITLPIRLRTPQRL